MMFAVLEVRQVLTRSCTGSVEQGFSFAWPKTERMFTIILEKILAFVPLDELELDWLFLVILSSWNLSAAPGFVSAKSSKILCPQFYLKVNDCCKYLLGRTYASPLDPLFTKLNWWSCEIQLDEKRPERFDVCHVSEFVNRSIHPSGIDEVKG